MSQTILQVRDISLSFKGVKAINALSFEVQRGEICALIGPNGAGKSSLLNVLNGVYRFDAGEIVFEQQHFHRIDPLGAARRGIGRTFQNNALFKKMSVLDNILTGLSRHTRTRFIEQALGLPRNTYKRLGDVFKKDGVVSTPIEERSRYLYALSQELEHTLSLIDGVILARVHPVLPERLVPGEAALPSSCSVLIKHRSDWDPALYEDRIRRLVVSSIPGLARTPRSAVSIVFVPAAPVAQVQELGPASGTAARKESLPWGRWLMIGCLTVVIFLSSGVLVWQWVLERRASRALTAQAVALPDRGD